MDRINNPYRPGAGAPPPALVGRDELIDGLTLMLRRALAGRPGKSYMPIGLHGGGKTVLLNRFAQIAQDEGMHVGFIEASEVGDFRHVLAIRLRKVLLQLGRHRVRRAVKKALGALKSFTLQLPDGTSIALGVDALPGHADSGLLSEDLTDVLVAVGEAARECETGLMLAVDEIQYLSSEELGALIAGIHRTTQLELPVVLVGCGLPQLPGLAGDAKTYAERLFEFPKIGALSPKQTVDALALPARDFHVEYEPAALEAIVEASHGYPYFLQEWGYHIWNAAPASPISANDVLSVRQEVMTTLDENFFLVRTDRLTRKEKSYLRAMAELGPGPHRSGDIAAKLGVKVASVAHRRSTLIAKGMLYSPEYGETAFTVPLFDAFLRRKIRWEG